MKAEHAGLEGMDDEREQRDYADGYEKGWEEASSFIDRHPHGMPWAAEQHAPGHEDEEPSAYDKGHEVGWNERMEKEGWR